MRTNFIRPRVEFVENGGTVMRMVGYITIQNLSQEILFRVREQPEIIVPEGDLDFEDLYADDALVRILFPCMNLFDFRAFFLEYPRISYLYQIDSGLLKLKVGGRCYELNVESGQCFPVES